MSNITFKTNDPIFLHIAYNAVAGHEVSVVYESPLWNKGHSR